ncbi:MAG: putative porin [Bacteroidales bacterium]|nr:putative porin [Bacteroidales bacterium]
MKKTLLIFLVLTVAVFAAAGRRPHFSRSERAGYPIISDTVVYKVDSTGAIVTNMEGEPEIDTTATWLLRESLDTLSHIFWSMDTATLPMLDTLIKEYEDSIVNNLPGEREFRQWRRDQRKAYRDSVTQNKPRILETFVIPDSLYYKRVLRWTHDQGTNKIKFEKIDTSYNYHFFDLPIYKNDADATYLGTAGSASLPTNYFNRKDFDIAPFFTPYMDYSYTPESMPFYNTKTPYTVLSYWGNPFGVITSEEDDLNLMTTQNIIPELNITLAYQRYGSNGQLNNEKTNNRTFSIGSNYTGKKYEMHFGYMGQTIERNENGGIQDPFWVCDTIVDAKSIEVNLSNAKTALKRRSLFLTQSLAVPMNFFRKNADSLAVGQGTVIYLGHSFEWSKYTKLYTDEISSSDATGKAFYRDQFNIFSNASHDSLAVNRLENKLFVTLQPFGPDAIVSTINGGFGVQSLRLYSYHPSDFITGVKPTSQFNTYVYGGADGKFKKYFAWDASGKLNLTGYYSGDMNLQGNVRFSMFPIRDGIHLTGHIETSLKTPHPFLKSVLFNHHQWDYDLKKTSETRLTGELSIPRLNLKAFVGYALLTNMLYYNETATIAQAESPVHVLTGYLTENIKLGPVHLDHRVLYQVSSDNEVLPLPKLTLNLRYYIQFQVVKNVMTMQIGANGIMYTKYFLQAYEPDLGVFYNQKEREWGNTPYVDAFVNVQWKRASLFAKYCNVLHPLTKGDYFSAFNYIRPTELFKFGLYWPFYVE